ncbi:DNA polymerase III subunit delta' [Weissella oryzae]|nr:DNA polymerase III subunit delta' [Weissella oryzae]
MKAKEIIEQATNKQPRLLAQLSQAASHNRLAHAYLFSGPNGRGQSELVDWLAMRLLCPNISQTGQPDGDCDQCRRIANHEHPDVINIHAEGKTIKVEQVRFLRDEFSKTPIEGHHKVFIIHDADRLTTSAANGLLKFIEEPSAEQTAILLTENKAQILPTIISRTQVIEIPSLAPAQMKAALLELSYSPELAGLAQQLTDNLDLAATWLVDDWFMQSVAAIKKLVAAIIQGQSDAFVMVQVELLPLAKGNVEQDTLLAILGQAWRDILLMKVDGPAEGSFMDNPQWQTIITSLPLAKVVKILDATLHAPQRLQRNISFQTTLEALILESQLELAGA